MIIQILVGVPGSGKSSYVKRMAKDEEHIHLSSDDIREELFEEVTYDSEESKETFRVMNERLFSLIEENKKDIVYYDATNLNRKRRRVLYRYK